jgi:hypothetical protein
MSNIDYSVNQYNDMILNSKEYQTIINEINSINNQIQNLALDPNTQTFIRDLQARKINLENKLDSSKINSSKLIIPSGSTSTSIGPRESQENIAKKIVNGTILIPRNLNLIESYNFIFDQVGIKDPYIIEYIWSQYDKIDSINLIPIQVIRVLKQVISDKQELGVLINLYDKLIKKYIEDRDLMDQELNVNYALKSYVSILEYVLKVYISPATYAIIIKYLTQSVYDMNLPDFNLAIESIQTNKFNYSKQNSSNILYEESITLEEYVINRLPMRMIKQILKIYNDVDDPDSSTMFNDVFIPIENAIKSNPTIKITDSSPIMVNLKSSIEPYISKVYNVVISEFVSTLKAYDRYLLNGYQFIRVWQLLV